MQPSCLTSQWAGTGHATLSGLLHGGCPALEKWQDSRHHQWCLTKKAKDEEARPLWCWLGIPTCQRSQLTSSTAVPKLVCWLDWWHGLILWQHIAMAGAMEIKSNPNDICMKSPWHCCNLWSACELHDEWLHALDVCQTCWHSGNHVHSLATHHCHSHLLQIQSTDKLSDRINVAIRHTDPGRLAIDQETNNLVACHNPGFKLVLQLWLWLDNIDTPSLLLSMFFGFLLDWVFFLSLHSGLEADQQHIFVLIDADTCG